MKTKAKLVLALSVLTAGTAVAGATGTFAWFTTNRSATLTYSKVTAFNSHGNLEVEIHKLSDEGATENNKQPSADGTVQAVHTVEGVSSATTDVSSQDGITVVKPIWKGESGEGKSIYKTEAATMGKEYVMYYFSVSNIGENTLNIFLDNGTAIKATSDANDKDVALRNYSRVAINEFAGTEAPTTKSTFKASNTKAFEYNVGTMGKYLPAATEADTATSVAMTTTHWTDALPATTSATDTTSDQHLATLAKGAKKFFVVSVWLEGTKADGADFKKCAGGSISVDIALSAYEAA